MRFDLIIMNPPFKDTLHLKVLNVMNKLVLNEVVCLHTAAWLQFPLRKSIKTSFNNNVKDLEVINREEANTVFGIEGCKDLLITMLNKQYNRGLQENEWINVHNNVTNKEALLSIYNKLLNKKVKHYFKTKLKKKPTSTYPLRVFNTDVNVGANKGKNAFISGCRDYNNACIKTTGIHVRFIDFNTESERYNCWKSHLTDFSRYCVFINENVSLLPYMNDYTKPWTNKRFCDYFGITGYVSDTEATPGSEWEEIIKTMKEFK